MPFPGPTIRLIATSPEASRTCRGSAHLSIRALPPLTGTPHQEQASPDFRPAPLPPRNGRAPIFQHAEECRQNPTSPRSPAPTATAPLPGAANGRGSGGWGRGSKYCSDRCRAESVASRPIWLVPYRGFRDAAGCLHGPPPYPPPPPSSRAAGPISTSITLPLAARPMRTRRADIARELHHLVEGRARQITGLPPALAVAGPDDGGAVALSKNCRFSASKMLGPQRRHVAQQNQRACDRPVERMKTLLSAKTPCRRRSRDLPPPAPRAPRVPRRFLLAAMTGDHDSCPAAFEASAVRAIRRGIRVFAVKPGQQLVARLPRPCGLPGRRREAPRPTGRIERLSILPRSGCLGCGRVAISVRSPPTAMRVMSSAVGASGPTGCAPGGHPIKSGKPFSLGTARAAGRADPPAPRRPTPAASRLPGSTRHADLPDLAASLADRRRNDASSGSVTAEAPNTTIRSRAAAIRAISALTASTSWATGFLD